MAVDWLDFCVAIDSIPGGASCGPDGLSAIIMKKGKVPISRMLCKIFRTSLDTGKIPIMLKSAFISGIHKGGSRSAPVNYRPISLTSHAVKSMERVLRKVLVNYLDYNLKLDPNQHGSRAGRSTLSQLLQHHDEILSALENGENLDCVYLDFSKAYDKVDHGILLHKLRAIGITGKLGRWIANFLSERKQQVLVKGRKSEVAILKSGVPQGSVLGPLMFLLFIGDISKDVTASTLIYVDDAKVKDPIRKIEDVENFQDNLDKIYSWAHNNNMQFNGDKFLLLRYGKNRKIHEETVYFTSEMENVIDQTNQCRDLGVIMEETASFDAHIDKVCKKVRQKCGWLFRTFYSRNPAFLRHMWNTIIQPHIDYCSQLWAPQEGGQLEKIERLFKNFTSKIPGLKNLSYWERLKEIKLNSMQRRFERYKIIYMWKIRQCLVPNCGVNFTETEDKGVQAMVRNLKPFARKLRADSFQESGAILFNCIPKHLRNLKKIGLDEFKEKLDAFLTKIPDHPKIDGLIPVPLDPTTVRHSNSLSHQVQHQARWGTQD